jgi:hypothetical protein
MNGPVPGPSGTEQQALDLPAVQASYAAARASRRRGVMTEHSHQLLDEACTAAGATPGAYDHRILTWLAGWEPQTCAVAAALITRAHAAGLARAGAGVLTAEQATVLIRAVADAQTYRMREAAEHCAGCETHPRGACDDHLDDIAAARACHDLAAGLAHALPGAGKEAGDD